MRCVYATIDDKWIPRHKCKVARLFILECEYSSEDNELRNVKELKEIGKCSSKKEWEIVELEHGISTHALSRSPNPKTMRLLERIQGYVAVVLIDIGSMHKFMDISILKKA